MTHAIDCDMDDDCTCGLAQLELVVDDLVVTRRTVTVDRHCPNCGVDLVGTGTLRHIEAAFQKRRVDVEADADEISIDWGDHDVEACDHDYAAEWQCAKCDHVLAQADVEGDR